MRPPIFVEIYAFSIALYGEFRCSIIWLSKTVSKVSGLLKEFASAVIALIPFFWQC